MAHQSSRGLSQENLEFETSLDIQGVQGHCGLYNEVLSQKQIFKKWIVQILESLDNEFPFAVLESVILSYMLEML